MRLIAFDGRYLINRRNGLGVDSASFLSFFQTLGCEIVIFGFNDQIDELRNLYPNYEIRNLGFKLLAIASSIFKPNLTLRDCDVVFLSQVHPVRFYRNNEILFIIRIHDLFPFTHPKFFTLKSRVAFALGMSHLTVRDLVVSNSWYTYHELLRIKWEKFHDNRALVVYCKVETTESIQCQNCTVCCNGLPEQDYFLSIGTNEPRKNLESLLSVWSKKDIPQQLVIVSNHGWKEIRFERYSDSKIRVMDDLCENAIDRLYSSSVGYISVSLDEGFDIPAVQATLYSLPVIVSDIPVHREMLSDYEYTYWLDDSQSNILPILKEIQAISLPTQYPPNRPIEAWTRHVSELFAYFLKMK